LYSTVLFRLFLHGDIADKHALTLMIDGGIACIFEGLKRLLMLLRGFDHWPKSFDIQVLFVYVLGELIGEFLNRRKLHPIETAPRSFFLPLKTIVGIELVRSVSRVLQLSKFIYRGLLKRITATDYLLLLILL